MYDWPEVRPATDALWAALAKALGVTASLARPADYHAPWHAPELLFSQTCGFPLTHELAGKAAYVATPHYACDGCSGPNYSSIVFARRAAPPEDFRGGRAAVNSRDSMSGMLALKLVFATYAVDGRFFAATRVTGGHAASLAAVRDGEADVCAIDAVCLALAREHRPGLLEGLVEIARGPHVAGLPYITGPARDVEPLRAALLGVFADPALTEVRRALHLDGLSVLAASAYGRILDYANATAGFEL